MSSTKVWGDSESDEDYDPASPSSPKTSPTTPPPEKKEKEADEAQKLEWPITKELAAKMLHKAYQIDADTSMKIIQLIPGDTLTQASFQKLLTMLSHKIANAQMEPYAAKLQPRSEEEEAMVNEREKEIDNSTRA